MKNWMKNIFHKKAKRFSMEEIKNYDPSKKDAQQRAMEEAMTEDEFLSDAVDGMKSPNAAGHFEGFSQHFLMDARFRTKAKFPWLKLAIGSVFLTLTFYFLHWIQEQSHFYPEVPQNQGLIEGVSFVDEVIMEEAPSPSESFIEESIIEPETGVSDPQLKTDFAEALKVQDTVNIVMRPIALKSSAAPMEIVPKVRNYWWIDHYKLKKYHYTLDGDQLNPVLSGTGADNKPLTIEAEKDRLEVWNYTDYWKRTFRALKAEKYAEVAFYSSNLLNKYERDENAIFYRALALYHQQKYKQAAWDFKVLIQEESIVFYEEAQFYYAMSLKFQGKLSLAKDLFEDIVKAKGFYAEKAQEELQK